MNEDMDIRDLPDEVRRAAGRDLLLFGGCYVIRNEDGSYEHVPIQDVTLYYQQRKAP